jgi:arabinose-5-phosphate isomerase
MTGNMHSKLAVLSDVVLNCGVSREACPMGLAPTASTTAALALGDAIAMAVIDERGFKKGDFARSHPAGALGKKALK